MSSLARRTVRTTAAVAGMAALGAGLAGNALAAPAAGVEAPEAASALQGLPSSVPLAGLPGATAAPNLANLPMLFVFQGPTVNTSGPSGTPAPSTAPLPDVDEVSGSGQVPGLDSVPTPDSALPAGAVDGSVNGVALPVSGAPSDRSDRSDRSETEADPAPSTPGQVGALSALDSAGLFSRLAQERLVDEGGFGMSTAGGGLAERPVRPQLAISIRSRHSTHPARQPPHSPVRRGTRERSMYQQKPVIIVTMASGIATIRVARAVSSVSRPNAMVSGATRRITGPPGSSMP